MSDIRKEIAYETLNVMARTDAENAQLLIEQQATIDKLNKDNDNLRIANKMLSDNLLSYTEELAQDKRELVDLLLTAADVTENASATIFERMDYAQRMREKAERFIK